MRTSHRSPLALPSNLASSLAPTVAQLVARIDDDWRRSGFVQADFPAISSEALSAIAPFSALDPVAIIESIAAGEARDAFVGEHRSPQVVPVYAGPRFSLTLHLWQDHLQTAHSHAWCGAYQVLHGVSVNGCYSFDEESRYDAKMRLGKLRQTRLELLEPGAIVPVERGDARMIHGVCYLDPLGLSLCTRTTENDPAMTHDFFDPGVAIQGSHTDRGTLERFGSFDALVALNPETALAVLGDILDGEDLRTCFYWLRHAAANLRNSMDVDALLERAAHRFGRDADTVIGAIAGAERAVRLRERRHALKERDHRFLFGALHQARSLAAVEEIVATRYHEEAPRAFIQRCLVEMAETEGEPGWSLLGTPITSDYGPVLVALVDDPRTEVVLARLAEEYGVDETRAMESDLREACAALRSLLTLRPLFSREAQ
jgi:hypothetical protein